MGKETFKCTSKTSRRRLEGRLLAATGATVTTTYTANLPKTATVDTAALKTAVESITPTKIVEMAKTSGITVAAPSAITATVPTAVVKKVAVYPTTTKAAATTTAASSAVQISPTNVQGKFTVTVTGDLAKNVGKIKDMICAMFKTLPCAQITVVVQAARRRLAGFDPRQLASKKFAILYVVALKKGDKINDKAVTSALNMNAATWKSKLNTALAGTGVSITRVDSVTAPSAVAANEKASFANRHIWSIMAAVVMMSVA